MRILLILFFVISPHMAIAGTGLDLINNCEEAKKLWSGKAGIIEKGYSCSNLIKGIVVTMIITANSSDKETAYRLGICNPSNNGHFIPLEQAILVVYKYLEDNPQKLHEYDFLLVMEALKESFRCPKP